ncbi:MAG: hypothetical protein IJ181_04575 [Acidaminococcaceae bacterium]|nr:hypothetical protein [Acidaminococcaceae bacterium]
MQKSSDIQKLIGFPLTDAGNAERLQLILGRDWRYCPQMKKWLKWSGKNWQETETSVLRVAAVEAFRELCDETYRLPKPADKYERSRRDAVISFIEKSENIGKVTSALQFLEGLLQIDYSSFDLNPWLLNVQNGTLELKTGKIREHSRNDYLLHICNAPYVEFPDSTLWTKTVKEILPIASIRAWVQRFVGYALTGSTREEKFVVAYGSGGSGKGTLWDTIGAAMGTYKTTIPVDVLLANAIQTTGNNPTPEIAKLPGKRLVLSSESGKNRRLDEAKVKLLTGGDVITARRINAQPFEFKPSFKLVLETNFLPSLADSLDAGIRRRMVIIPFDAKFESRNERLKEELLLPENLAACLSWVIKGAQMWQAGGLKDVPTEAQEAAQRYFEENDLIGQWLNERTEPSTGFLKFDIALRDLNTWLTAGGSGNCVFGRKGFSESMERHGKIKERRTQGYGFPGLQLKN